MILQCIYKLTCLYLVAHHVFGKKELNASQVTAGLGLLKKVLADQQHTTVANDPDNPLLAATSIELLAKLR